ncbi:MAG TPA: glycosyltransferase family 39 protein [Pseudolabrys sp.]|nr:glycosyltransferase family 39 protein [Pseudolabrys sp.]
MGGFGPLNRVLGGVGRLRDALIDPVRRERNILLVLAVYTLLWTLYGVFAKGSQDVHPDMAELVGWAREPSLGYAKHPPLAAWLVWLWFSIFPVADWSYYLLGALTASVALWIIWRLCADYLAPDKRVLGLALVTLIPFFGFHALKYNVNTLLIPLWAATTLCFLRSLERHDALWAALAGLFAGAAMLTKYWSIFLIGGLVIAAFADVRRLAYFRSAAPWITIVVGALVIAPHLVWLVRNDFMPFAYAAEVHGSKGLATTAYAAAGYLLGSIGYVAAPVVLALIAARANRAVYADILWPDDAARRLVVVAFWAVLLLPIPGALASGTEITSLWSMSAWTLLPIVLLAPPRLVIAPEQELRLIAIAIAFPILLLLASPLIAISVHRNGLPTEQTQGSLLAPAVERLWRETTDKPLRIVAGGLAYQVAFYAKDRPDAFPDFNADGMPWLSAARIRNDGLAIICRADSQHCLSEAQTWIAKAPAGKRTEVTVARKHAGIAGTPERYVLIMVPPQQ